MDERTSLGEEFEGLCGAGERVVEGSGGSELFGELKVGEVAEAIEVGRIL